MGEETAYLSETFAESVMSSSKRSTRLRDDLISLQGSQTWNGSWCQVNKSTS